MRAIKTVAGSGLLLAGVAFIFFFLYFLPKFMEDQELHKRILECRKLAEEHYARSIKENKQFKELGYGSINYTNHFNAKLKECFYCETKITATADPLVNSQIIGLYANEILATDISPTPAKQNAESLKEWNRFERRRRELFEE